MVIIKPMLTALKKFKAFGQDYGPGDVLPDRKKWDILALQSCLNIGWIEETSGTEIHVKKETPDIQCPNCDKVFMSERGLKIHSASQHK